MWQPLFEQSALPGGPAGDRSWLYIPVLSLRLLSQRFMVGIDTEKVFATSSLGVPASTAESTLNLRSFEYGFMEGGYHTCRSILTGAAVSTGLVVGVLWGLWHLPRKLLGKRRYRRNDLPG